jgi:hypothetical protein
MVQMLARAGVRPVEQRQSTGKRVRTWIVIAPAALNVARDPDSRRCLDRSGNLAREQLNVVARDYIVAGVRDSQGEGLGKSSRAVGDRPLNGNSPSVGHQHLTLERFRGTNQHCASTTVQMCDQVEAEMDAIASVDVDRPRFRSHYFGSRSPIHGGVRGQVSLVAVRLRLDYPTRDWYARDEPNQGATNEIACHRIGLALEKPAVELVSQFF